MKENGKFSLAHYRKGIVLIEIQSLIPEKFINLMWKNNVYIKNIKKKNITTMTMEINLKDYYGIEDIAQKTGTQIKIIKRRGIVFLIIKLKRRITLVTGVVLFIGIIYYLSTFIWSIEITSDKGLPPYIIRQQLKNYGVKPGINKNKINVYKLEEELIKNNDSIMWVKIRIDGSKLSVNAVERKSPPNIIKEDEPCNLIAKKDGKVVRIYTTLGTPVVKIGEDIKKGQILVKGQQGQEPSSYGVAAAGYVICRTSYEDTETVNLNSIKRQRTGNKIQNYYITIGNKKLYLKKNDNKFNNYDKIEESKFMLTKETYFEVKEVTVKGDLQKTVKDSGDKLYKKICSNLDKSINVLDKVVSYEQGDYCKVKVQVIAEENVAIQDKIENTEKEQN